jgi:hypothetical protein
MSAPPEVPDVVARAFDVARRRGYVSFCRNETGRLLAALAASRTGTMAEFGTGTGIGTAWLRSGLRGGSQIVTAELDPKLAGAAAEIFTEDDHVEVLAADWSKLGVRGPFSLSSAPSRCSSSMPASPRTAAPTRWPSSSSPEGWSSSTTSPRAPPGHLCTADGSTPCARTGWSTSGSPPSRSWSLRTPLSSSPHVASRPRSPPAHQERTKAPLHVGR